VFQSIRWEILISQYFYCSAFQFWNYGEVVKLQQSEWVFFLGSLMAVIDMKALAILED
jgi:hypothetical protein